MHITGIIYIWFEGHMHNVDLYAYGLYLYWNKFNETSHKIITKEQLSNECAKLLASRAFAPYMPTCLTFQLTLRTHVSHVTSCLCFVRVLRTFTHLYEPFVPSVFTCLTCLHFLGAFLALSFLWDLRAFSFLRALRDFSFLRGLRAFIF